MVSASSSSPPSAPPSSVWLEGARAAPRRALYVFSILASLCGFWALTRSTGLSMSGNAVAYAEAIHHSVAPVAAGRIEELLVRVGQRVSTGEPLAVMDGRALRASGEKARLVLAELEAAVVAVSQDVELKMARNELALLKARADERGTRAALVELTQRTQRLDALLGEQMIQADPAESARERQSQLAARIEAYDEAQQQGQVALQPGGTSRREQARAAQIQSEPARQAVRVQKASLAQLELEHEQLTLRAPVDGVVSLVSHRAGEVVGAGAEVISLVSARPGVLIAELPETVAAQVELGQGVSLRPRGSLTRALRGRVIELAPEVDELSARARPSPAIAAWGRRATLQLDEGTEILPGQAFNVSLD